MPLLTATAVYKLKVIKPQPVKIVVTTIERDHSISNGPIYVMSQVLIIHLGI